MTNKQSEKEPARDLIVEAGKIARGESLMIGSTEHVRELVDVIGGALLELVEAPTSDSTARARALLVRLEGVES
jgi:hypothetical protein